MSIFHWAFFDSSSEGEENQRQKKSTEHEEAAMKKIFAVCNRENFDFIVRSFLSDDVYDTRGGSCTPAQKMKFFLRYVGDPGFQVKSLFLHPCWL